MSNIKVSTGTTFNYHAVTYSGVFGIATYCAVSLTTSSNKAAASYDGKIWNEFTTGINVAWRAIAASAGNVAAVGTGGVIMYTSDCSFSWTSATSPTVQDLYGITFGNSKFVAVGNSGAVITSPDGITWTSRTAAAANNWKSVAYGNSTFVAVSSSGTNRVMTSTDGISWTSRSTPTAESWNTVVWNGSKFLASSLGSAIVAMSSDGITWVQYSTGLGFSITKLASGPRGFVGVSPTGMASSVDGIHWKQRRNPVASINYTGVASNGENFVMLDGTNTSIYYTDRLSL